MRTLIRPRVDPTTESLASALLLLPHLTTRLVVVGFRSVAFLNIVENRRARKQMTVLEMMRDPLFSRLHYVMSRPIIRGQRTFEGLLNDSHLELRCDKIWTVSRISPIGRTKLLRRHPPAVA